MPTKEWPMKQKEKGLAQVQAIDDSKEESKKRAHQKANNCITPAMIYSRAQAPAALRIVYFEANAFVGRSVHHMGTQYSHCKSVVLHQTMLHPVQQPPHQHTCNNKGHIWPIGHSSCLKLSIRPEYKITLVLEPSSLWG
jgi:hypothetical protein